jgi:hypothetical protein
VQVIANNNKKYNLEKAIDVVALSGPFLFHDVTRQVPHVELKLLTLLVHLISPLVFSGVRVSRSLVLCVCVVNPWLSFCTFSVG